MDERERWKLGTWALLALALVLFLLLVLLNAGTILVGLVLEIFKVLLIALVAVALFELVWWTGRRILSTLANAEGRIRDELNSLRRTLYRATTKLGADVLSFVTGGLALVIQESLTTHPLLYRVSISLLFAVVFFLAAQLIGSNLTRDKILGTFFFLAPVVTFIVGLLMTVSPQAASAWIAQRTAGDLFVIGALIVSLLLTFAFAWLKSRDVANEGPVA